MAGCSCHRIIIVAPLRCGPEGIRPPAEPIVIEAAKSKERQRYLVTRDNRGLYVTTAVEHMAEHFMQAGERRFAGNVVGAQNFLLRNQTKRAPHGRRCVMEGCLQRDL